MAHTFLKLDIVGCSSQVRGAYLIPALLHAPRIRHCFSISLAPTTAMVVLAARALDHNPVFHGLLPHLPGNRAVPPDSGNKVSVHLSA